MGLLIKLFSICFEILKNNFNRKRFIANTVTLHITVVHSDKPDGHNLCIFQIQNYTFFYIGTISSVMTFQ